MFSIYGISGQVLSGTLEEMNRVNALGRVPITSEAGRLMAFVSRGDVLRAVVTDPPPSPRRWCACAGIKNTRGVRQSRGDRD
jgi:CBS domain-containing protein